MTTAKKWMILILLCLITVGIYLFIPKAKYEEITLFEPQEENIFYRIPGLVVSESRTGRTLIAYCEKRKGLSDHGDITLVYRTSKDGKTWSDEKILAENTDGSTYNNPVMIADGEGNIHCIYCKEYGIESHGGGVFYIKSSDGGGTWSAPQNISECTYPGYRNVFATGPGHGICTHDGTLIVPVWMVPKSYGKEIDSHRPAVVSTLYSKDEGNTWQLGEIIEANVEVTDPNESSVVELRDGNIMINCRNDSHKKCRSVATSPDGIKGWSTLRLDEQLPDPICYGSLARYGSSTILFANCNSQSERKNISVKISHDDGETWNEGKTIINESGEYAGYADINTNGNEIYMLSEKLDNGKYTLKFFMFNMKWLLK